MENESLRLLIATGSRSLLPGSRRSTAWSSRSTGAHQLTKDGGLDSCGPPGAERPAEVVGRGELAELVIDHHAGRLADLADGAADAMDLATRPWPGGRHVPRGSKLVSPGATKALLRLGVDADRYERVAIYTRERGALVPAQLQPIARLRTREPEALGQHSPSPGSTGPTLSQAASIRSNWRQSTPVVPPVSLGLTSQDEEACCDESTESPAMIVLSWLLRRRATLSAIVWRVLVRVVRVGRSSPSVTESESMSSRVID